MSNENHTVATVDRKVDLRQVGASARRNAEGHIVITNIGYYGDEIVLTKEILEHLGFIPFHDEAP